MDNVQARHDVMTRVAFGTEVQIEEYMLSVVVNSAGQAQALLRTMNGLIIACTDIVGPENGPKAIEP